MKSILKEIKKFRKLTKLNESNEFDSKVVLIGDDIAYLLYDKDFEPADGMISCVPPGTIIVPFNRLFAFAIIHHLDASL